MSDNFEVSGLPDNNDIHTTDKSKTDPMRELGIDITSEDFKHALNELSSMKPDELKMQLPDNVIELLKKQCDNVGADLDDVIASATASIQAMISNIGTNTSAEDIYKIICSFEEGDGSESDESEYVLDESRWLFPSDFGQIECVEDEDIYKRFIEKYGTDSTKYISRLNGVQSFVLDEITEQLPIGNITDLKYISNTNRFIVFYAATNIANSYGFFIAVFEKPNGDFAVYIPEFMNTFDITEEDDDNITADLFNPLEHPDLFDVSADGMTTFKRLDINAFSVGVNYVLAPKKKVLLSPHQFGMIKNARSSIRSDSDMIRVGTIVSNETPDAVLFKKDSDLDLDKKAFPFYIRFPSTVSGSTLQELSELFFDVDFNNAKILDYLELYHTSDGKLYVNMDLGAL